MLKLMYESNVAIFKYKQSAQKVMNRSAMNSTVGKDDRNFSKFVINQNKQSRNPLKPIISKVILLVVIRLETNWQHTSF